MTNSKSFEAAFCESRLHGEAPPSDLSALLSHRSTLTELTGIAFNSSPDWAPFLDTSYLRESDWANPDIRANVRAIRDVCKLIDFVAEDEDRNYYGYWRGPTKIALPQAPIVCLDNEGQFDFCGTANIAGALLSRSGRFEELRPWLLSIGISPLPSGPYDLSDIECHPSPRQLHDDLYEKYAAEERAA